MPVGSLHTNPGPFTHPSRSLSDFQESSQFLCGEALPVSLLNSLLSKTSISTSETCVMFNLTAYDGWLERTAKKWADVGAPPVQFKIMSFAKTVPIAQYVEKSLALELMQDFDREYLDHSQPLKLIYNNIITKTMLILNSSLRV